MREFDRSRLYQTVWTMFGIAFVVNLFFFIQRATRTVKVQHVTANWTASERLPWGESAHIEQGRVPVTIFYQTGRGYCFDFIFSEQVKQALDATQQPHIDVAYNVFSYRGKYAGYEVASVAGIAFKHGQPPDSDGWAEGGNVSNNCHN